MIRQCLVKEYQGHRWLFRKHQYNDNYDMEDTLKELPTIELTAPMAKLLADQLGILQNYQNDDQRHLLHFNLILDFIKENKDIDKDIMIAFINNLDKVIK